MAQVALIAGASSGLGRAVAEKLAADGFIVYAGARSFASGKAAPEGCVPLVLDVTDHASVEAAVSFVLEREGRVDALVNCAARLTLGACEETSVEEFRQVMETNYVGLVRMTQAVLPAMRAQGAGRIVQFSSLNGLFGIPFQGAYIASKHAVEGFSDALALEVRRFGITVTVVSPGDCRGGSDVYRGHAAAATREKKSVYHFYYKAATEKIHRDETNGLAPEKVAAAVSKALRARHAPSRVVVAGFDQKIAVWLHDVLPGRLFRRVIEAYYAPKEFTR
ncbi:MAG: SDR family oxidoreductase [Firmicutes bacterium]|nr:SDR family oxidoreductase [Bacillota bacterium]